MAVDKYQLLFDSEKKRISKTFQRLHKVENLENDVIVFTYNYENPTSPTFTRLLADHSDSAESIQELNYSSGVAAGKILGNLLEKYFGENVVIPYDIDTRVKLFSQAYEDLESYVKHYR